MIFMTSSTMMETLRSGKIRYLYKYERFCKWFKWTYYARGYFPEVERISVKLSRRKMECREKYP